MEFNIIVKVSMAKRQAGRPVSRSELEALVAAEEAKIIEDIVATIAKNVKDSQEKKAEK